MSGKKSKKRKKDDHIVYWVECNHIVDLTRRNTIKDFLDELCYLGIISQGYVTINLKAK